MIDQIRTPRTSGTGRSGRKRKRRSYQPKKQRERKATLLLGVLFGTGLPLLVAFFLGVLWNKVRCQSEEFRQALNGHLSELLNAEVDVGQLQLQGRVLSALKVTVAGKGEGIVQSADLRRVRAQLSYSSFLGGDWKVQSLTVQEGELRLHGAAEAGEKDFSTVFPRAKVLSAGLGLSNRPGSWGIESLQVRDFNLFWGSERDGAEQSLKGSRIFGGEFSDDIVLHLMGGEARLARGNVFDFREAKLRWEGGKIQIEKGEMVLEELKPEKRLSKIFFSGLLLPGAEARAELDLVLEDLGLTFFLDPVWKERIGGSVHGDVRVLREFSSAHPQTDWRGLLRIDGAWMRGLKLWDDLASLSKESRFRRVEFEDGLKCRVTRDAEGLTIGEIEAATPGLIKLSGEVRVGSESTLSGGLQLGLPEALLIGFPGGKPGAFGVARAGFCYTEVLPGGTLELPTENLGARLAPRPAAAVAGGAPQRSIPSKVSASGGRIDASSGRTLSTNEKQRLEQLFNALLEE